MNIIETNLKFNANHSNRNVKMPGIVLHHAACNASVQSIHNSHKARGYAGIGYHFYVRKDGKVYRGRPENWIGAHTVGHNAKIGICAEGNFENERMAAVQKVAIIELLAYLFKKYGTVPVYRHKELDATACPGKYYPFDDIVAQAKAYKEPTPAASEPQASTSKVKAKDAAKYFLNSLSGTYTVTCSALNVRHGAGTSKAVMACIPKGTRVRCYGYYSTSLGVKWLYILFEYKGITYQGFASSLYLKK